MIRFYYQDDQYPTFGEYYCEQCALVAGADLEQSWLSAYVYCPLCNKRSF
jgi:hypothetical protein